MMIKVATAGATRAWPARAEMAQPARVQYRALQSKVSQPPGGALEELDDRPDNEGQVGRVIQREAQDAVADQDGEGIHLNHIVDVAAVGGDIGVADAQQLGQDAAVGVSSLDSINSYSQVPRQAFRSSSFQEAVVISGSFSSSGK